MGTWLTSISGFLYDEIIMGFSSLKFYYIFSISVIIVRHYLDTY